MSFYRNQYEIEYQHFVDGIVGSTFEYFCQLIIKNSMENIKRTQNALSSFSFTNTSKYLAIDTILIRVRLKQTSNVFILF